MYSLFGHIHDPRAKTNILFLLVYNKYECPESTFQLRYVARRWYLLAGLFLEFFFFLPQGFISPSLRDTLKPTSTVNSDLIRYSICVEEMPIYPAPACLMLPKQFSRIYEYVIVVYRFYK